MPSKIIVDPADPIAALDALRNENLTIEIVLIGSAARERLMCQALAGDAIAALLVESLAVCVRKIAVAPKHKPMQCFCCDRALKPSPSLTCAALVPIAGRPRPILTAGLCFRCGARSDALGKVMQRVRDLAPPLRSLRLVSTGPTAVQ